MSDYEITLFNCNVVDVVAGEILEDQCIVVALDGKIAHIVTNDSKESFAPLSRYSFNCEGSYVMPGLIDCHVHVTAFTANFAVLERTTPSYVTAKAMQSLKSMLKRGFTTVRDAGGADHGLASALEEGIFKGPRLLFCGKALSQTGGHGDMRAPGDFAKAFDCTCAGLGRVCDGDAEVRKAARDEIRKGATHIKVMAGGGVSSPTDRITSTQFSIMELKAIVEEATAANIHVMAHAYTPRAIINSVKAGVKSIEHGNLLDEESAKVMAKAGTYLVPTLATYDALAKEGKKDGLSEEMARKIYDVLDAGKRSIGIAKDNGVVMCYGSDLLSEMRKYQLSGLSMMEDSGLPAIDVIRSVTSNAASLLGMEAEIGSIEVGKIADMIIIRKNPLESTRLFDNWEENYVSVIKQGRIVFNEFTDA